MPISLRLLLTPTPVNAKRPGVLNKIFLDDTVITLPPMAVLPPPDMVTKAPSIFSLPAAGLAQNQFFSHLSVLFLPGQVTVNALPLIFQVPHFFPSFCFDKAASNS